MLGSKNNDLRTYDDENGNHLYNAAPKISNQLEGIHNLPNNENEQKNLFQKAWDSVVGFWKSINCRECKKCLTFDRENEAQIGGE